MSYLDNLYRPPMDEDREILNEEYLLEHNIDIDNELIDFINENYEVLQALLDEGYDITNILNERTLYTYTPKKNDAFDNIRRTLTNDEKKCFDAMHNYRVRQKAIEKGVLQFERKIEKMKKKGLPVPNTYLSMTKNAKDEINTNEKNDYGAEGTIARSHMYTGKIGINKSEYKSRLAKKRKEIDPNLVERKQQIRDRLLKSNLFLSLPQEKQNQLLRKIDKKSLAFTMRGILNHEMEHGNQYDIIKKELGNGNKIGEYKAITKAARKYGEEVKQGTRNPFTAFRFYASTPFEYGANLKARNQLTPQQSRELALHQVDPIKYPLKSIRIDPNKGEYMALHPLYQLKDNRGRLYNYDEKQDALSRRVEARKRLLRPKPSNSNEFSRTVNLLSFIKNRKK